MLALFFGFVFYLANGLIIASPDFVAFYYAFGFFGMLWNVFLVSLNFTPWVLIESFVGVIVLSVVFGMMASLLFYRYRVVRNPEMKKVGLIGGIGVALGAAAPGCASCGVGVLSVIGAGSFLTFLPFKGKEVLYVAIALTGFSVVKISEKLYNPVCQIDIGVESLKANQRVSFKNFDAQKYLTNDRNHSHHFSHTFKKLKGGEKK